MSTNATTATNRYGALPDTAFHLERFAGFGRPILEPACGTGRTLVPFLEAATTPPASARSASLANYARSRRSGLAPSP